MTSVHCDAVKEGGGRTSLNSVKSSLKYLLRAEISKNCENNFVLLFYSGPTENNYQDMGSLYLYLYYEMQFVTL